MSKVLLTFLIIIMATANHLKAQENNNFYDDAETYSLSGPMTIEIEGEVNSPGRINLDVLPGHSVIVKEAVLKGDSNSFTGAYRYDGYSLFDILNNFVPDKKNKDEFDPIIDLFVEVVNIDGESVVLSWGEIYYPVHLHEIIIATSVMRIVPSKTKELWPLPEKTKLVVAHDLLTERNISSPSKIIVHSAAKSFKVDRGLTPLYSPSITYFIQDNISLKIMGSYDDLLQLGYESVFYGRGRGIHSTTPFEGVMLKDILDWENPVDRRKIQSGYFIIAAADGYRAVFTYSEVFNRNDQSEFLIIEDENNNDGGVYRIFPAPDFFSDRAIKAVSEIWFMMN
jgi:hypothetical protein